MESLDFVMWVGAAEGFGCFLDQQLLSSGVWVSLLVAEAGEAAGLLHMPISEALDFNRAQLKSTVPTSPLDTLKASGRAPRPHENGEKTAPLFSP